MSESAAERAEKLLSAQEVRALELNMTPESVRLNVPRALLRELLDENERLRNRTKEIQIAESKRLAKYEKEAARTKDLFKQAREWLTEHGDFEGRRWPQDGKGNTTRPDASTFDRACIAMLLDERSKLRGEVFQIAADISDDIAFAEAHHAEQEGHVIFHSLTVDMPDRLDRLKRLLRTAALADPEGTEG